MASDKDDVTPARSNLKAVGLFGAVALAAGIISGTSAIFALAVGDWLGISLDGWPGRWVLIGLNSASIGVLTGSAVWWRARSRAGRRLVLDRTLRGTGIFVAWFSSLGISTFVSFVLVSGFVDLHLGDIETISWAVLAAINPAFCFGGLARDLTLEGAQSARHP